MHDYGTTPKNAGSPGAHDDTEINEPLYLTSAPPGELFQQSHRYSCVHITRVGSLNNLIEQGHRNIKRRIRLMLGFKSFRRAQAILAGIELIHMIRKGQYQHPAGDGMSLAEQFYLMAA